jgi:hypothetical protein
MLLCRQDLIKELNEGKEGSSTLDGIGRSVLRSSNLFPKGKRLTELLKFEECCLLGYIS